jgi:hypothetical protein
VLLYHLQIFNLVNLPILDRSRDLAKFSMIFCFVMKLIYTKVVDNLCIYVLLKFGGIWPCSLRVIADQSWVSVMFALCLAQTRFGV